MKKLISTLCSLAAVLAFQAKTFGQTVTITNEPQSITVNNASTATFTVGASGATNYQWQFNTTNLTDGTNSDGVIISGSATSQLTLEDVTSNEAGNYTVVINGLVSNSSPAVLTITNGTVVRFIFSGFIGGGTSNVDVQLFDHDKPATVANFIHYINSGAFVNMFFQRLQQGFVLQGGSYDATNPTNTTSPITGSAITNNLTAGFPAQVDNEFGVGPTIKNDFGTIAMALDSGETNSATSGFFFNLTNNSGAPNNLDSQDFTVFGRILSGTNTLQYFNRLSAGNGIYTGTTFVSPGYTNVPVDYYGTSAPANTNLVFATFAFPNGSPAPDTTAPTVTITSQPTPAVITNLQGTASDNVAVAVVNVVLTPLAASDGTYPYPNTNALETNYAVGTTNWSFAPYPGSYNVSVQSQDGSGNLSTNATESVLVTAVVTNGNGTVTFTNGTTDNFNAVGYPFQIGSGYTLVATPAANWAFLNWSADDQIVLDPSVPFTMSDGFVRTATFITNGIPDSIAITYPAPNAILSNGTVNITGTIATNIAAPPVTVVATLYSMSTGYQVGSAITNIGTNTWSVTPTNLPNDSYSVQVIATDFQGNTTATNENFTVAPFAPLDLVIVGDGTVTPVTNGEYFEVGTNFEATATPAAGQHFYGWSDGTQIYTNTTETFTMTSNLTLTAEFVSTDVPKVISFSYPPANAKLNTNTFEIKVRLASSAKSAQVICQISSSTGEVVAPLTLTETSPNLWTATVSDLPPNEYEINAIATYDTGGKSVSSALSEVFSVLAFKGVAGTYTGLFICNSGNPVMPTNSGFCTFTVGDSGAFSARFVFPAYGSVGVNGSFFPNGSADAYKLHLPSDNPADLGYWDFNLTNGLDELSGYVYSEVNGVFSWYSQFTCYRAVTKLSADTTPPVGKYVFNLNPTGWSNNGYATLSVNSGGALNLSGALPDGSTFSQSARVSKNGMWPLYVVPSGYNKKGMLLGWETWQTNGEGSFTGDLTWYKGPDTGTYYTSGINTNVNSTGTNYAAPAAGDYSIVFQEGTNGVPVTNTLTLAHSGGQFSPGTTTDKLAISLSSSGVLTGHFVGTNSTKALQFKGAFFGQSQGGSGFILDDNGQTGSFLLEPQGAQ